jgi:hypothetical protein
MNAGTQCAGRSSRASDAIPNASKTWSISWNAWIGSAGFPSSATGILGCLSSPKLPAHGLQPQFRATVVCRRAFRRRAVEPALCNPQFSVGES